MVYPVNKKVEKSVYYTGGVYMKTGLYDTKEKMVIYEGSQGKEDIYMKLMI